MTGENGQERSLQHMHENKETRHPANQAYPYKSFKICICYCADLYALWQQCVLHACGWQLSLTVIRDQALAGSKQQVNFAASCLDQLDGAGVCDALRGLAVDLHDLISNL